MTDEGTTINISKSNKHEHTLYNCPFGDPAKHMLIQPQGALDTVALGLDEHLNFVLMTQFLCGNLIIRKKIVKRGWFGHNKEVEYEGPALIQYIPRKEAEQ